MKKQYTFTAIAGLISLLIGLTGCTQYVEPAHENTTIYTAPTPEPTPEPPCTIYTETNEYPAEQELTEVNECPINPEYSPYQGTAVTQSGEFHAYGVELTLISPAVLSWARMSCNGLISVGKEDGNGDIHEFYLDSFGNEVPPGEVPEVYQCPGCDACPLGAESNIPWRFYGNFKLTNEGAEVVTGMCAIRLLAGGSWILVDKHDNIVATFDAVSVTHLSENLLAFTDRVYLTDCISGYRHIWNWGKVGLIAIGEQVIVC